MSIISEKIIKIANRDYSIIRIETEIDSFNYQIAVDELEARIFMGEKSIILDFLNCNNFSIDAIKALENINLKYREKNGVFYIINANERVKQNLEFLSKYDNIKIKVQDEVVAELKEKMKEEKESDIEVRFKVFHKKEIIKNLVFHKKKIFIGRRQDCDIVLKDEERVISKRHAYIEVVKDGVIIVDTSKNGTFINDIKIRMSSLRNGTLIRIKDYLIQINYKINLKKGV